MGKKLGVISILATMLIGLLPTMASANVIEQGFPEIEAGSYIVVEGGSGEIIFGKNYLEKLNPASITKIMTAVLAIESGKLEDMVTISAIPKSIAEDTTVIYLREGEKMKLENLVEAAVVYSANDAAFAIGEHLAGSTEKFAQMMNEKAKAIGMKNTNFVNAHGLTEEGHLTTAEDMAILGRYAMSIDKYRSICQMKTVTSKSENYPNILGNKNQLLDIMPEATGVKNGFTSAAKHTLVGSAQKDGRELIGVIMGTTANNVYNDMKNLLNYGFDNTKVVPIIEGESLLTTVVFSEKKTMRIVAKEDFAVTLLKESNATVDYGMKLNDWKLPIKKGDVVGGIEVRVDGNIIHEVPLISSDAIRKPINWLLVATGLISCLYFVQILLRTWRMIFKKRLKMVKTVAREPQQRQATPKPNDDYQSFVSGLNHPPAKEPTPPKTPTPKGRDFTRKM